MNLDAASPEMVLMRFLNRYYGKTGFAIASSIFAWRVYPGHRWDLKVPIQGGPSGTGPTKGNCPTADCKHLLNPNTQEPDTDSWTVTLCDECHRWDVPGNIYFGLVGRMAGFGKWYLHFGAGVAQHLNEFPWNLWKNLWANQDDPPDQVAIDVGFAVYQTLQDKWLLWDLILQAAGLGLLELFPVLLWTTMTPEQMTTRINQKLQQLGITLPPLDVTVSDVSSCIGSLSSSQTAVLKTYVPSSCSACCQESWSPSP